MKKEELKRISIINISHIIEKTRKKRDKGSKMESKINEKENRLQRREYNN